MNVCEIERGEFWRIRSKSVNVELAYTHILGGKKCFSYIGEKDVLMRLQRGTLVFLPGLGGNTRSRTLRISWIFGISGTRRSANVFEPNSRETVCRGENGFRIDFPNVTSRDSARSRLRCVNYHPLWVLLFSFVSPLLTTVNKQLNRENFLLDINCKLRAGRKMNISEWLKGVNREKGVHSLQKV